MSARSRSFFPALVITATVSLAGCAGGDLNDFMSTGSITGESEKTNIAQQTKVDPACVTLISQIDTLRKEGVQAKVEQAATKKYKLTKAELAKADQLNKANADFQAKCSTLSPPASLAAATAPATKQ